MNTTRKRKMTLTLEEQKAVKGGQSETKTKTFSKALLFFYDEIKRFEQSGKKIDYSLENGQTKTRIWFDEKSMAVLMIFSYQQVEIDLQQVGEDIVSDIEVWWQEKHQKKDKRG